MMLAGCLILLPTVVLIAEALALVLLGRSWGGGRHAYSIRHTEARQERRQEGAMTDRDPTEDLPRANEARAHDKATIRAAVSLILFAVAVSIALIWVAL